MGRSLFFCVGVLAWFCLEPQALSQAKFNRGARTAMQFVKIGVGARQVAMGEACISNVTDVNAAFWNPAALRGVTSVQTSFSYTSWFADLQYVAGAAGVRLDGIGVVALSYSQLDYGEIDEALTLSPTGSSDTRIGRASAGGDLLVAVSFSREFTDRLSIGMGVKYLREKLFNYSADVYAFDVGTFYETGFRGIRFGMAAQNFAGSVNWGPERTLRTEGYEIPLVFRLGVSMELIRSEDAFIDMGPEHRFMIGADAIHTNDYSERFHLGAEYWFENLVALRTGYRLNYEEGNWSFGVGVQQSLYDFLVYVDYAFVSYQYLESPHRLTISFSF